MEFPVIDEARSEAAAVAVVVAAPSGIDLAKVSLTDVALSNFSLAQQAINDAEAALKDVEHDLSTPAKLKEAISTRNRLIKLPIAATRATSVALRSKLDGVAKDVTAHEAKLVKEFERVAGYITPQIEAREKAIADAKRLDDERKAKHTTAIARIAGYVAKAVESSAAVLAENIPKVEAISVDGFEEFTSEAQATKDRTLASLRALHDKAVAREAEAARLAQVASEQAEAARKLAEERAQLERDRAELEALRAAVAPAAPAPLPPAAAPEPAPAPVEHVVQDPPRVFDRAATHVQPQIAEDDAPGLALESGEFVPASQLNAPAQPDNRPPLTTGAISDRLGFIVAAGFVERLGITPAPRPEGAKAGTFWRAADFPRICDALVAHINTVKERACSAT